VAHADGRMHLQNLKARTSRLLSGEVRVDDITKLYAGLRSKSFGCASFREIADFAAHPDERERGPVTQVVRDLITTFTPLLDRALRVGPLSIEKILDRVWSNFRLATDQQLLEICGRGRQSTKKIVEAGLAKLRKGEGASLTELEVKILSGLGDRLVWNPAFRGDQIFAEFKTVLLKNKILDQRDASKLDIARDLVLLHAIVTMHGTAYVLENGARGEMQAGIERGKNHLEVTTAISFKGYSNPVHMNPCVVWTGLDASLFCEPALAERSGRWGFPIEIQDGRLKPIGELPAKQPDDAVEFKLG
jgi:hypothetical protein